MPEEGVGAAPTVVQVEEGEEDHNGDAAPGHQAHGRHEEGDVGNKHKEKRWDVVLGEGGGEVITWVRW